MTITAPITCSRFSTGCWSRCQAGGIRLLAQPVDVADPMVGEQVRGLVTETHVDGIVLSSPVTDCDAVLRVLEAMDVPFVRISPGTNHALTSSVYMDDAQAADDMTTHLINFGHRRIGFIKGHPNHMASDERLFGYRRALDRAGIAYEPQLVADGEFDFDSGVRAGRCCSMPQRRRPRSFAANDDMAAGVLAVAHDRGLDLPGDLSVAGFDDTTLARIGLAAAHHDPPADVRSGAHRHRDPHRRRRHQPSPPPHTLVERASIAPPKRKPA
jgi:LacI family transcriptional regulator